MSLTTRQHQVFQFMASRIREGGVCPSVREIGEHIGVPSCGSVHRVIQHIVAAGFLEPAKHRSRGWTLPKPTNLVPLNDELLFVVDQYASAHQIPRDAAVERLIRNGASA